ncbi:hypothetical protein Taro_016475, partial [Colocasia esculenta]|nr:hypothetical protein [Colocasia esculenta]
HPTVVSVTLSLVPFMVAPVGVVSLTSWSVRGVGWFCLWALDLVEVRGGCAYGETLLLTWLIGVSRGDTWLFLPDLVEVWDVGCLCRETLVSRGRSGVSMSFFVSEGLQERGRRSKNSFSPQDPLLLGLFSTSNNLWQRARVCAEGCCRIVFDSAGSAGVVFGPTLVVVEAFLYFRRFVVLCGWRFPLYCFVE